jgi:hypothetical protein
VEHNEIILKIAAERDVLPVDLDREMTGQESYFIDHIHCDGMGRIKKAELISASLTRPRGLTRYLRQSGSLSVVDNSQLLLPGLPSGAEPGK